MPSAQLFIDYQNLHLSAYECFAPYGTEVHDSLIHPGKFGDQVLIARRANHFPDVSLEKIHVFRGLPSRNKEGKAHSRNQRRNRGGELGWSVPTRVTLALSEAPTSRRPHTGQAATRIRIETCHRDRP